MHESLRTSRSDQVGIEWQCDLCHRLHGVLPLQYTAHGVDCNRIEWTSDHRVTREGRVLRKRRISDYKKTNSNRKENTTNMSERRAKGALLLCRIVDFHVVHHSLDVLLTMQHGPAPSQGCRLDLSLKPTTLLWQRTAGCAQAGRACAVWVACAGERCWFVCSCMAYGTTRIEAHRATGP